MDDLPIDERCLAGLKKIGKNWPAAAIGLASQLEEVGASQADLRLGFIADGDQAAAKYVAEVILRVKLA